MGLTSLIKTLHTKDPEPCDLVLKSEKLSEHELCVSRYQNGPNLGALFVQEKWIDSSLFNGDAGGSSELAALESWGSKPDLKDLQQKWEHHWETFVGDDDFELMRSRGVTCVRLPIGFWSLGDAKLLKHTPFEKYAQVYDRSWHYVKRVIDTAGHHQIGVLVDFHAVPGGANGDEHSGTSSGKAELWEHSRLRTQAIDVYRAAIDKLAGLQNVVGLQLVNEAPYGQDKAWPFYRDAAAAIRSKSRLLPLVISDGWDCHGMCEKVGKAHEYLARDGTEATGLVVDTHVYRTFSDDDKAKSADEHIKAAPQSVQPSDDVDIIVGEWSCCLDEASWQKSGGDRSAKEAEYGQRQLQGFANLAGNFFWTYKFGQGSGGSWDWREMSDRGVVLPRIEPNRGNRDEALQAAKQQHESYWHGVDSKQDWESWRFEDGFTQGWNDAEQFAQFNGSRPGLIHQLKAARLAQHSHNKGHSDKLWVYGQAYVQGIRSRVNA